MKKIVFITILIMTINLLKSQDIINVYAPWQNTQSVDYPDYENVNHPVNDFYWSSHTSNGAPNYNGEYQIYLGNFHWANHIGLNDPYYVSYSIEPVSFPFMPDANCCFATNGCIDANNPNRHLFLADDGVLVIDPFTNPEYYWDYSTHRLYLLTKGWFTRPGLVSEHQTTLVSVSFTGQPSATKKLLPHTVLKITVKLHCGGPTTSPSVITAFSFVYDNTRGRLRHYPFRNSNTAFPGPASFDKFYYDIVFMPELLVDGQGSGSHLYNTTSNADLFEYNAASVNSGGTINYFPYDEIDDNTPECTTYGTWTHWPDPTDNFLASWPSEFAFAPPYSLLSAHARSGGGADLAGYEVTTNPPGYVNMPGLKHKYHIDKNIVLTNINPVEKIIYNPSEADITATNLKFPTGYIFKTIRGQYPTYQEALADDVAVNGGPFTDPRDVPITTDVRSENATYENSGPKYASMYYLKNGSKLTIEGCVYIFDATFDCQTGSELVFENYPTNKNPERFNIEYNGGTVTKRANSFYFQAQTESRSILKFESDGIIEAGYSVTTAPYGNYTVASGANVTFTSDDAVTLKDGFTAVSGSQFVASAVASVTVPTCTPPQFRLATYSNSNEHFDNPEELKIIAWPNPTSGIFRVQLRNTESDTEKQIYVTDMFGKQLLPVETNYRSRNVIDLSNHPEGIYFVKVIEGDRIAVQKVVKM